MIAKNHKGQKVNQSTISTLSRELSLSISASFWIYLTFHLKKKNFIDSCTMKSKYYAASIGKSSVKTQRWLRCKEPSKDKPWCPKGATREAYWGCWSSVESSPATAHSQCGHPTQWSSSSSTSHSPTSTIAQASSQDCHLVLSLGGWSGHGVERALLSYIKAQKNLRSPEGFKEEETFELSLKDRWSFGWKGEEKIFQKKNKKVERQK